jgi:hypothetical protein
MWERSLNTAGQIAITSDCAIKRGDLEIRTRSVPCQAVHIARYCTDTPYIS